MSSEHDRQKIKNRQHAQLVAALVVIVTAFAAMFLWYWRVGSFPVGFDVHTNSLRLVTKEALASSSRDEEWSTEDLLIPRAMTLPGGSKKHVEVHLKGDIAIADIQPQPGAFFSLREDRGCVEIASPKLAEMRVADVDKSKAGSAALSETDVGFLGATSCSTKRLTFVARSVCGIDFEEYPSPAEPLEFISEVHDGQISLPSADRAELLSPQASASIRSATCDLVIEVTAPSTSDAAPTITVRGYGIATEANVGFLNTSRDIRPRLFEEWKSRDVLGGLFGVAAVVWSGVIGILRFLRKGVE
jgi:hypothetical protein